MKGEDDQKI